MTWIKICGITSIEDAQAAVGAGADAVGFVFYAKSPRNVTPETVRTITANLPARIENIGVFVNQPSSEIENTAESAGLTGFQLHFPNAPARPQEFSPSSYKRYLALSASRMLDPSSCLSGPIDAIFLDSGTPERPGGTGMTFDWKAAAVTVASLGRKHKIVVAGGLTPENVSDAIRMLKPWGVDVSSGVETRPGKKDPERLQAFIQSVRHIEVSV